MTDVASLELCKELYELSGWHDLEQYWEYYPVSKENRLRKCALDNVLPRALPEFITPAYPLGYLLRKLPKFTAIWQGANGKWTYSSFGISELPEFDTPEDAACELAIELIKQGVIKPQGDV